jgi:aryl-alcohol dehydrogenase-like predicted oxidoreductase
MRTTRLGDLTVSAQGLGCMGMSESYGPADLYGTGHNEVLVGRAIAGRRAALDITLTPASWPPWTPWPARSRVRGTENS